jgi:hypothetical protein
VKSILAYIENHDIACQDQHLMQNYNLYYAKHGNKSQFVLSTNEVVDPHLLKNMEKLHVEPGYKYGKSRVKTRNYCVPSDNNQ